MAAKGRIKIKLVSTGKNKKDKPTGTYYTTDKNKNAAAAKGASGSAKLEFKKFDRLAYNPETGKTGMHVLFKEDKIK